MEDGEGLKTQRGVHLVQHSFPTTPGRINILHHRFIQNVTSLDGNSPGGG